MVNETTDFLNILVQSTCARRAGLQISVSGVLQHCLAVPTNGVSELPGLEQCERGMEQCVNFSFMIGLDSLALFNYMLKGMT